MEQQEIKEIVTRHSHEKIQAIDQIVGKGQVNEIYIVTTITGEKYVLRIDPSESTTDRFNKEKWCMEAARATGVLVPDAFEVSLSKDRKPYMLLSYVEGVNGQDVNSSYQTEIWKALGGYAKKIHLIPITGYGEKLVSPGEFGGSWSAYIDYNISSLNAEDKLLSLNVITEEESGLLKNIFEKLKNTDFIFGLIHNDISLKNTILGSDGKVWLLDWGSAQVDIVPQMDFAEVVHSSLKTDSHDLNVFLENYGMSMDIFPGMKDEINRLQLLHFTDKVRWAIDRRPERITAKVAKFRAALEEIKENI